MTNLKTLLVTLATVVTLGAIAKPAIAQTNNTHYNLCDASQVTQFQQRVLGTIRPTGLTSSAEAAGATITVNGSGFSNLPSTGIFARVIASDYQCDVTSQDAMPVQIISDRELRFQLPANVANRTKPIVGEYMLEMVELFYQSPTSRGCNVDPRVARLNMDYVFGRNACDSQIPEPTFLSGYARSQTDFQINWQYPGEHQIDGFRVYKSTCTSICQVPEARDFKNTRIWEEMTSENNLLDSKKRSEPITAAAGTNFSQTTTYFVITAYSKQFGESVPSNVTRVNPRGAGGGQSQQEVTGGLVNVTIRDFVGEVNSSRQPLVSAFPYSSNSHQYTVGASGISYLDAGLNGPNGILDMYTGDDQYGIPFYATPTSDGSSTTIAQGRRYFRDAATGLQSNVVVDSRFHVAGISYFATAHLAYNAQTRTVSPVAIIAGNAGLYQDGIVAVSQSARSLTVNVTRVTAPTATSAGVIQGTVSGTVYSFVPTYTYGTSTTDQYGNYVPAQTIPAHMYQNTITMDFTLPLNKDF